MYATCINCILYWIAIHLKLGKLYFCNAFGMWEGDYVEQSITMCLFWKECKMNILQILQILYKNIVFVVVLLYVSFIINVLLLYVQRNCYIQNPLHRKKHKLPS